MEVDTRKDIEFYSHLVNILGQREADKIAPAIFTEDLSWMSWEVCQSSCPKAFFYKIVNVNGERRLVNQRDLLTTEDILTKINKGARKGLEFAQMNKVRSRLFLAENGAITTWTSPKKLLPDDPDYPLDQINIAKKIDEETIWVKQIQGQFVELTPGQTLRGLMLELGEDDLGIGWERSWEDSNTQPGEDYLEAIKQGLSASELKEKRNLILSSQGSFSGTVLTSCGAIDFGGRSAGSIPSWCEFNYITGEIRCKIWFCRKVLSGLEVNTHRCVC